MTGVIFGGGRGTDGAWAGVMVVSAAVACNPVQSLEVEQHDMVFVVDGLTQLFSTSIDFVDFTIATVPSFRLIKTIFIARCTRARTLCTEGWAAIKPLPTFSSKIQSNQVTNFNIPMASCTENLEYILAATVPVIPLHVHPRAIAVSTASGGC